jgi:N-methylhydantoinase A
MGYTIDIDTGGTFTDEFFACDRKVRTVKVPTTPHDLTVCFMDCFKAGAEAFGIAAEDMLFDTDIVRFSSTIGTNTIIQRDGSKIGLIVSKGTEDLAPGNDAGDKSPLVLPDMVIGINESVSGDGVLEQEPDIQ